MKPPITPAEIKAIKDLQKQGKTYDQIRETTGRSLSTISRALNGRSQQKTIAVANKAIKATSKSSNAKALEAIEPELVNCLNALLDCMHKVDVQTLNINAVGSVRLLKTHVVNLIPGVTE